MTQIPHPYVVIRRANSGVRTVFRSWHNDTDVIDYYKPFFNELGGGSYKKMCAFVNLCFQDIKDNYRNGSPY